MSSETSKFTQINPLKVQHLTFKNSAKHVMLKNELIEFVIKEIQKIPNYQELKNNLELIRFVCNMLENLISNNNEKIDKKQTVIDIISQLFCTFSDEDKKAISNHVQFLFDNKFIKKVSIVKKVKKTLISCAKLF
jgi:hypothetical protein